MQWWTQTEGMANQEDPCPAEGRSRGCGNSKERRLIRGSAWYCRMSKSLPGGEGGRAPQAEGEKSGAAIWVIFF